MSHKIEMHELNSENRITLASDSKSGKRLDMVIYLTNGEVIINYEIVHIKSYASIQDAINHYNSI